MNLYTKYEWMPISNMLLLLDLQLRNISYDIEGTDDDGKYIDDYYNFLFLNPKIGATYFTGDHTAYLSFAIANREPRRSDYIDRINSIQPLNEELYNIELGHTFSLRDFKFKSNFYYMYYRNQLILTGEVNDVGSSIRTNIPRSYRLGLELGADWKIMHNLDWNINTTLSRNRNIDFIENIINYDNGILESRELGNTWTALSPSHILSSTFSYRPFNGFRMSFLGKHVGKQYLDNTSSEDRIIDQFYYVNALLGYSFNTKFFETINLEFLINNITNNFYSSRGYTYAYIYEEEEIREDHFYPQAGINFLISISFDVRLQAK